MNSFITLARAAGYCGVAAIIILSLVPGPDRPHTGLPGPAEHFLAYCLTAMAFAVGARPMAQRLAFGAALSVLACSMEVLQHFVPGRHPSIKDAIASSAGGFLGLALGSVLLEFALQAYAKRRQAS
ncbi:MAG TPA: VanZ family protein [Methylocella sp.]|nr:VanZ family protein [Methylocella sp.]